MVSDFYCISCFKYFPLSERVPHGIYEVCSSCDGDNNFKDVDDESFIPRKKNKINKFSEKSIDYFIERYGDK